VSSERWSSSLTFLLASVGAAVGLGNIWRFSAVIGQNGGGAYLVPYLIAAFVCAVPLLVLELSIGRTLRTDVVSAFRSVDEDYAGFGWLVAGGVLVVLSYYLVLTGLVLGFFLSWLGGWGTSFATFVDSWVPVLLFVVVTGITGGIVSLGVRDGIERMATVVMPTVFVLLVGLALYATTLPGWRRALEFLFTPDLAVLDDIGLWSAAFGQVFFSLSVGQGIMLTFGSYVSADDDLLQSSLLITIADIGAAIVAGLVIFPIVFSSGLEPSLGTELAFRTLPAAFERMPAGRLVAIAFFGLLFFAALSSAVALLEVGVAATTNVTRLTRPRSTAVLTGGVFAIGLLSALSYSPIDLRLVGEPILDLVDESVGTFALPVSAILITLVFVWRADIETVTEDLGPVYPIVRYLVPPILIVTTGSKILGFGRPTWRLLLDHPTIPRFGFVVFVGVFALLVFFGWYYRDRFSRPRLRR
jgi:NSS family neurotransmitter:Na+ symporter